MPKMKIEPCPFCGARLVKGEAYERIADPVEIYEHPPNDCILSMNTDEFEYVVPVRMIPAWNRRVKNGRNRTAAVP